MHQGDQVRRQVGPDRAERRRLVLHMLQRHLER
jgi:hypothetical protein